MRIRPTRLCFMAALVVCVLAVATVAAGDEPGTTLIYPPFGHCLGIHKATSFHLFLYLGTRTHFNEPAGLAAVKLDALDDPSTHSDDDELTVFGLNSGECEIIYNTSLVNVTTYGERGSGPGQFRDPMGIAADTRGNVFVADTGNHRIVRLLYNDGRLEFIKSFGSEGSGELGFSGPSQVAVGQSGTLYISDTGNDRVVTMTPEGIWLSEITGDPGGALGEGGAGASSGGARLDRPVGLAVVEATDPWISRRQDFMVVSDRGGERVVKLSLDGDVLAVTSAADLGLSAAGFDGLAIDYYGSVFATDSANGRIHKLDRDLRHITSIGSPGTGDMELDEPRGITLWRRFGQIFVTEREGAQYFWIGTDILDLEVSPDRIAPGGDEFRLRYYLTEVARVTVELVDSGGSVVHTVVSNRRRATGENIEHWDGMLGRKGGPAPAGEYVLRVTATPTYSSGEYFNDTAETELVVTEPTSH